jgi:hypothetical protein
MTRSKKIMTEMRPNVNNITVTYGDMSQSEVLGLGKVVVAPDISLVDVMLVETLGYNLLSVCAVGNTTTGTPLQQRIDVLPNVYISVARVNTNGFCMRCRWWRCNGL